MFFVLSKIFDIFLSPYTWGIVLLALAVPWRLRAAKRWRRRRVFGIAGLAILLVASLEPVDNTLLYALEHSTTSTYRPDVQYDAVILLGGMTDDHVTAQEGQIAYNGSVERVIVTHELLRDDKAKLVIISGAATDPSLEEFGEARALAKQLKSWGIDERRIIIEDKARNTRENATYTAEIARARGLEKLVVVTSAMHMRRSIDCYRAVNLPVDTLSVDYRAPRRTPISIGMILPRTGPLNSTTNSTREILGRLFYRVVGYGR